MDRLRPAWRWWFWRWLVPGVVNDAELLQLLGITAAELGAIRQAAEIRVRSGHPVVFRTGRHGRRQWLLRRTLPIACATLRGMR